MEDDRPSAERAPQTAPGAARDGAAAARRIGVLGGTFDPIHLGHLAAASEALHALSLDEVVFVPAGRPWQKKDFSDAEDRFMMTMLAVSAHPRFSASRMELDRRGATYTVDTLEAMREFWGPEAELFFITGADSAAGIRTWHDPERLARIADVVAVTRSGTDARALQTDDESLPRVRVLEMPLVDVSGTEVRRRVGAGRPIDFLVPAEVVAYIREHGLYAASEEGSGA
jgi:nicotinate-nucleotide adenylyltransferase